MHAWRPLHAVVVFLPSFRSHRAVPLPAGSPTLPTGCQTLPSAARHPAWPGPAGGQTEPSGRPRLHSAAAQRRRHHSDGRKPAMRDQAQLRIASQIRGPESRHFLTVHADLPRIVTAIPNSHTPGPTSFVRAGVMGDRDKLLKWVPVSFCALVIASSIYIFHRLVISHLSLPQKV